MIKEGDKISVRYSRLLDKRGLGFLANKNAIVTKVLMLDRNVVGVFADVKVMRTVKNYYIPACSIVTSDEIDKTRTVSILKSTIL